MNFKTRITKFINTLLILLIISCLRCKKETKNFRFAVIKYQHETCTFCPGGGDTKIEDWTKNGRYLKGDKILKSGNFIRGFSNQANLFKDVKLIRINSPDHVFGGSSRSWNTKNSFEYFMEIILSDLKSKLPVDAVYLSLHGAMAVRDVPRPEVEIAKRVRKLVGPEIPIADSFDLHRNEDQEFLK